MKYTTKDVQALLNVEKKIIENNEVRKNEKLKEYIDGVDFTEQLEMLHALGDKCDWEVITSYLECPIWYRDGYVVLCGPNRNFKMTFDGYDIDVRLVPMAYKADYKGFAYKQLFKCKNDIERYLNNRVEIAYNNKLNKIYELANKEY